MFELTNTMVKLANVNPRAELHGDERRAAFDLKFEATLSNEYLVNFDSELRQFLYKRPDNPDLVDQQSEALTALRFPKMGHIKWDWECPGYKLVLEYGVSGAGDIPMEDVKVDNFAFDPQQGGAVIVTFRAICHPECNDVGRLCEFIQQKVQISLISPETLAANEAQQVIAHVKE